MSETVLFGKVKDQELIMLNFRGQLQCRMGRGERDGPIEAYPNFWNLYPVAWRNPAWKKVFDLVKKEIETILERDVLPVTIPEFTTVR